jgi:8-oxo-dGTP diphosphatase
MKKTHASFQLTALATDVVIFTIQKNQLQVLLIEMKKDPFLGMWAIPGGLVDVDESVDQAAGRHLLAKTGVKNVYLEQLYTFGDVRRDPYGRVVSVAYFALIPHKGISLKTTHEYGGVAWFPVHKLPKLAYDHKEMIRTAVDRLKAKLGYTTISYSLLPREFSLSELQQVYEIILGKTLDKRNFRRKILDRGLVRTTGNVRRGETSRPAALFAFKKRVPQLIELL